jgi:multiple sugar transport system permease protein
MSGATTEPAAPVAPARQPARRPVTAGRPWTRDRVETLVFRVLRWVAIAFFLVTTLFPFYYMVLLSLRTIQQFLLDPANLSFFGHVSAGGYGTVLKPVSKGGQGFLIFLRNSGIVAVLTVLVTLLVSIPGAYAVSRLKFAGHRQVHALFLAVYLFPSILLAIPLFALFTRLGLRGSLFALVIVYISQTVPVSIYMMRNYFETIPRSLEEAAMVDGASRLVVIRRISLPLAKPAIMATSLYVFMIAWNEYLFALLFLVEDRDHWTVPLGLALLSGSVEIPTTVLMAGSVILTVPIIILFYLTERLLTEGLTSGAEKG